MDHLFCDICGSLLELPGSSQHVICNECQTTHKCSDLENHKVITRTRPNAFSKLTKVTDDFEYSGAIIEEKCSKCGHGQMKFFTMQLRSADEGQTVFYTSSRIRSTPDGFYLMFSLIRIDDNIGVNPQNFSKPFIEAVTTELNKKYCHKLIPDIGIAIRVFDVIANGDPIVRVGEGSYYTKVTFRLIVFRPFIGEIIFGKIYASSENGLVISLGFFHNVIVPPSFFPENSEYSEDDKVWIWNYEGEKIYLDAGEVVKFRVLNITYVEEKCLFTITASICEPGLGCVRWWEEC